MKTHRHPVGHAQLLLHEAHGDAQLLCAVLQDLHIHKVLGQTDMPENGFFQLQIQRIELGVDAHACDLALQVPPGGLEPVNVLFTALHQGDDGGNTQGHWTLALHALFDEDHVADIDDSHS